MGLGKVANATSYSPYIFLNIKIIERIVVSKLISIENQSAVPGQMLVEYLGG